jgi:hypothetical protein
VVTSTESDGADFDKSAYGIPLIVTDGMWPSVWQMTVLRCIDFPGEPPDWGQHDLS